MLRRSLRPTELPPRLPLVLRRRPLTVVVTCHLVRRSRSRILKPASRARRFHYWLLERFLLFLTLSDLLLLRRRALRLACIDRCLPLQRPNQSVVIRRGPAIAI